MDNKIRDTLLILDYSVFTIILILTSVLNDNRIATYILFCIFFTTYTIRRFFFSENGENLNKGFYFILADILITTLISCNNKSLYSLIIFIFLLDEAIINYNKEKRYLLIVATYIGFLISATISFYTNLKAFIIILLLSIPIFAIAILFYYLISELINKNIEIENNLRALTLRRIEQENLYKELEMLTIEKERNRIAGEIHDTVGHNLTACITQLEVAKRWFEKDFEKGMNALRIAENQVRNGLFEIRRAVRIMEKEEENINFYASIVGCIEECKKSFNINIRFFIKEEIYLDNDTSNFIIRTLKECITNGVKHGNATAFIFKLNVLNNNLLFEIEDNGQGAKLVKEGFGISNIKKKVEILKGSLNIDTKKGEGFTLKFKVPLGGAVDD